MASCIRSDEQNGARIRSASRVLPGNNGSGTAWVGLVGRPSFIGPKAPMFCAPGDLPWRAINRDTTKSRADLLGLLKLPFCKDLLPCTRSHGFLRSTFECRVCSGLFRGRRGRIQRSSPRQFPCSPAKITFDQHFVGAQLSMVASDY